MVIPKFCIIYYLYESDCTNFTKRKEKKGECTMSNIDRLCKEIEELEAEFNRNLGYEEDFIISEISIKLKRSDRGCLNTEPGYRSLPSYINDTPFIPVSDHRIRGIGGNESHEPNTYPSIDERTVRLNRINAWLNRKKKRERFIYEKVNGSFNQAPQYIKKMEHDTTLQNEKRMRLYREAAYWKILQTKSIPSYMRRYTAKNYSDPNRYAMRIIYSLKRINDFMDKYRPVFKTLKLSKYNSDIIYLNYEIGKLNTSISYSDFLSLFPDYLKRDAFKYLYGCKTMNLQLCREYDLINKIIYIGIFKYILCNDFDCYTYFDIFYEYIKKEIQEKWHSQYPELKVSPWHMSSIINFYSGEIIELDIRPELDKLTAELF